MSQELMRRFLNECGCSGPIQLIAQNPASGDTLRRSLEQPFAIIGRNPKADVPLEDEEVSHRHAYLQIYEGRVFCLDLKSRTGTHWDNGPQEYGWLEGKQTIRVGSYRIKRVDGDPGDGESDAEPLVSRPLKNPAMGAVSLEFMPRHGDPEVDEPLAHWKMQRVLALVGRGSTCKVRLVHPSVSRVHCSLVRTPLGLWVIDLLGRKGTQVNGVLVPFALLGDGDRLQIGRFLIRIRYDSAPPPGDAPAGDAEDETMEVDSPSNIVLMSTPSKETSEGDSSPDLSPDPASSVSLLEPIEPTDPPDEPADAPVPPAPSLSRGGSEGEKSANLLETAPPPATRKRPLIRSSSRALTKAEWMETILPAITDQFAQMQQQMFDQFQQGMVMMFRTFGQLHREQMDMVRQELDRIHQLTQQLHELQMELAKHPAAAGDPAVREMLAALPPVPAEAPLSEPAFSLSPEDSWEAAIAKAAGQWDRAEDQSSDKNLLDISLVEEHPPLPQVASEPELQVADLVSATIAQENEGGQPPTESPPDPGERFRGGEEAPESEPAPPTQPPQDIHLLLCRQIAALQEERQSRWQKILGFLTGKTRGEPVP